jgi:hypothetical protein
MFLSQPNGSGIGPVVIQKVPLAKLAFGQVKELLLTQQVRLLSP